jgi:Na+-transporting NADH:ubiquinone oxidoreductase subunit A
MITIRKGLDLPIAGTPRGEIADAPRIRTVAVLCTEYPGLKPALLVREGDRVGRGQALFRDKQDEEILYTAPASGLVSAIHRGPKRALLSVVIDVTGDGNEVTFGSHSASALSRLGRDTVRAQLLASGQWTALRTRPYGRVPAPDTVPASIFVTAMDTHPLAPDPAILIRERETDFRDGLAVLTRLTDGPVRVCRAAGADLPAFAGDRVREEVFAGPHPAGNAGTHIHFLDPVGRHKTVWVAGYQDVIAIGRLFTTGRLHTERVVSLAGPQVEDPCLIRTRAGASLEELTAGRLRPGENRIISGSVLHGHAARGPLAFLGRLANQVSVLREGRERHLLGYLAPGLDRHSAFNIYLSRLMPGKRFAFTTSTHGSERAMVPLGQYEAIMPLDILATQLLRALVVGDTETAEALGALELVEEDLALCSYVCAAKYEYGPILRDVLDRIETEG